MRALVIEDEESVARVNTRLLKDEGFVVDVAGTVGDGTAFVRGGSYDLILLDAASISDWNGVQKETPPSRGKDASDARAEELLAVGVPRP